MKKFLMVSALLALGTASAYATDRVRGAGPCQRAAIAAGRAFLEKQVPERFDLMSIKSKGTNQIELEFSNDEETDFVLATVKPGRIPDTCRVTHLELEDSNS